MQGVTIKDFKKGKCETSWVSYLFFDPLNELDASKHYKGDCSVSNAKLA